LKVWIISVGRAGRLLAEAIDAYETRARRYWALETVEIREERAGQGKTPEQVRAAESDRLLARVPPGTELIALTRGGEAWGSAKLARYLDEAAVQAKPGVAFLIGGALGISAEVLARVQRRITLSSFTLPHELARLILAEQLYRAGTIRRGEPYHKGDDLA